jgi:signal transduction histidine kinase
VIREARSRGDEAPDHCDLAGIVGERTAFWGVLAGDQGRPLTIDVPAALEVHLTARDATTVIDTLLENVFAHTAPPAAIRVTLSAAGVLAVEDGGGGFDPTAVRRGTSGGRSTGLGLDIVRRIAERSGGSLAVERSALGGARVVVALGTR